MKSRRKQRDSAFDGYATKVGNQVAYNYGMLVALPSLVRVPASAPSGNMACATPVQGQTFLHKLQVSVQAGSAQRAVPRKPKGEPKGQEQNTSLPWDYRGNTRAEIPVPQPTALAATGFCLPESVEVDMPSCTVATTNVSAVLVPGAGSEDQAVRCAAPSKTEPVSNDKRNLADASDGRTSESGEAILTSGADRSAPPGSAVVPGTTQAARSGAALSELPIETLALNAAGGQIMTAPHTPDRSTGGVPAPSTSAEELNREAADPRLLAATAGISGTILPTADNQVRAECQGSTPLDTPRNGPAKLKQDGGRSNAPAVLPAISPGENMSVSPRVSVAPANTTVADTPVQASGGAPGVSLSGSKGGRPNSGDDKPSATAAPAVSKDGSVHLHALDSSGATFDLLPATAAKAASAPAELQHHEQAVGAAMPDIGAGRLVQSMSRSEMQVHINAQEFGRISIHTAYGRDAISAQITFQNDQLGSAVALHLSSIEQKLAHDHGMRASVIVDAQSSNSNSQSAGGDPQQSRKPRAYVPSQRSREGSSLADESAAGPIPTGVSLSKRLDIRI